MASQVIYQYEGSIAGWPLVQDMARCTLFVHSPRIQYVVELDTVLYASLTNRRHIDTSLHLLSAYNQHIKGVIGTKQKRPSSILSQTTLLLFK